MENLQLNVAVEQGNLYAAKRLLCLCKANVNFSFNGHRTILHTATIKNDIPMVELLLRHGADVNPAPGGKKTMLSPLWIATLHQFKKVADLLIRAGADVNERIGPEGPRFSRDVADTFLHAAVRYRDEETTRLLLHHGANPGARNARSEGVLQTAVAAGCHALMVSLLLEHGAPIGQSDILGRTTLHEAAAIGNEDLVKLLIAYGADIQARHGSGKSALHFATQAPRESLPLVKLLLKAGLRIDDPDRIHRQTPLHLALMTGKNATVQLLLEEGGSACSRTRSGQTSLQLAVECCSPQVVQMLLERGADPRERTCSGRTALHTACRVGCERKIQLLVESGAEVGAQDAEGRTAFQLLESRSSRAACAMTRELVRLEATGSPVNEADVRDLRADPHLRSLLEECLQELSRMQATRLYGTVSYFAILARSPDRTAACLRNPEFAEAFAAGDHANLFPIYADHLDSKIRTATRRQEHIGKIEEYLDCAFAPYLPRTVLARISLYLSVNDVRL